MNLSTPIVLTIWFADNFESMIGLYFSTLDTKRLGERRRRRKQDYRLAFFESIKKYGSVD